MRTERALAAGVWRARHAFELEAAARFERLSRELAALGAADAVVAMAQTAAVDEVRHAALCAELVVHFGGAAPVATPRPAPSIAPPGVDDPRARVLSEVIALACVTETLSTALLGALVEQATDATVRAAMHSILADEVQHARLGWAHLAAEHARGARDVVGEHLPAMLRATVTQELFSDEREHPEQDALSGLGALSRRDRVRAFNATLTHVVFPGLERFGVDTARGRRWLASL